MERKKNLPPLGNVPPAVRFNQLIHTLSDECGGIGGNGWMYIPSLDIRGGPNAYFNKNRKWSDVKSMFYLQVRF